MIIKRYVVFFILFCFATTYMSCSSSRKEVRIGYAEDLPTVINRSFFEILGKNGWQADSLVGMNDISEERLSTMSALIVPFSQLNRLDYRTVPLLKRYLELGGGGIVLIRDTVFTLKGWPWLEEWTDKDEASKWEESKGHVSLLSKEPSADQLEKALRYAIGKNRLPRVERAKTLAVPDSNRYTRTVLTEGLDEPLGMAILPGNDVLFVERKGGVKLYKDSTREVKTLANFSVFSGIEDGLLGVAIDPGFDRNNWVYFYYAMAGERAVNRLSRFVLKNDSLHSSETVILEIPTQRIYCCHSAGYLKFDKVGNLYLSTGDNTNAEETNGYTPVDERPGHELADDQATAANTNDLRGKILRIRPLEKGGYGIPEGNLFPKDGKSGRPEIYIMGARNPYRFSVDDRTGFLYFGDVGPDTKLHAADGELMSFDEINQVRKPGFFGWPYFLGNNDVFPKYNYETEKLAPGKDPAKPMNTSPNNTGAKALPPAQPAMIWYGKSNSTYFPLVGNGGASAMAGPVYYRENFNGAPFRLSSYYEGKLFIYEWIRGWIMAITFDKDGNYLRMEPFLDHMKFDAPVDLQFAPDGAIYLLEYGTNWFSKNQNAKLVRIEYAESNRNPLAAIHMDHQYGGAPMTVQFSGRESVDPDGGRLSYNWQVDEKSYQGDSVSHTFEQAGIYQAVLTVKDSLGGTGRATASVYVGNTPPEVKIKTKANRSFYWDDTNLDYHVDVSDKEEKVVPERISISFGYIPHGKDAAIVLASGQEASSFQYMKGRQLIANLDCRSCHAVDQESVGPTYQAVSARYKGQVGADKLLAKKVIQGGSGNWGERTMSPHPELSESDAEEIVNYILSLSAEREKLPLHGQLSFHSHQGKGNDGVYLLSASYRDQGANGIEPLQGNDYIALRYPRLQAEDFDEGNVSIGTITTAFLSFITSVRDKSYSKFTSIDLTHIKRLNLRAQTSGTGGTVELRLGSREGAVVSRIEIPSGTSSGATDGWKELSASVIPTNGTHDLYFVFVNKTSNGQSLFNIDWFAFNHH